ncbi:Transposase protein [Tritrichomonas musculus]|uniref:Transposase protein n=1 Tax=Tritrichomonas musculus TaxID=1915356 RepID=A0ABR2KLN5_9EUKA
MDPSITLQLNKYKSQLEDLKASYNGLQHQYEMLKAKFEKSKDENKCLKEKLEIKDLCSDNLLRNEILKNINKNQNRLPNGHRFSENIFFLSQLIHNISPKCYEILHDILILPSISQLTDFYSSDNNFLMECIQKLENIPILIEKYKEINNFDEPINCILSIDAAGLDRPYKNSLSYVFVFYLQPFDSKYKCLPLHVFPKKNGSANKEIIDIANKIKNILMQHNINIKLIATDGDTKYNSKSQQTFSKYIGEFIQNGFLSAIQKVENSEETFWISDFLHLLKLARKQFIKGPITIRNTIKHVFTNKSLEDDLKLGAPLIDTTSLSYMKDFYAIKIFSLENVIKLLEKKKKRLINLFIAFCIMAGIFDVNNFEKVNKITFSRNCISNILSFLLSIEIFKI